MVAGLVPAGERRRKPGSMPGQNANWPVRAPIRTSRMGAFWLGAGWRSPPGGGHVLAANLAFHPDEPDGDVWSDGGGGCPLVSGRCCISNSILKGARQRTARTFSSEQNRETQLTTGRRTFQQPTLRPALGNRPRKGEGVKSRKEQAAEARAFGGRLPLHPL